MRLKAILLLIALQPLFVYSEGTFDKPKVKLSLLLIPSRCGAPKLLPNSFTSTINSMYLVSFPFSRNIYFSTGIAQIDKGFKWDIGFVSGESFRFDTHEYGVGIPLCLEYIDKRLRFGVGLNPSYMIKRNSYTRMQRRVFSDYFVLLSYDALKWKKNTMGFGLSISQTIYRNRGIKYVFPYQSVGFVVSYTRTFGNST